MASSITPQVLGPDGGYRTALIFSTTLGSRFFSGIADPSTIDIEVSIRGGAFTRDPDLISFDGTRWLLPNPSAFPDGLDLQPGSNLILIRAITLSGSVSSAATIEARLIQTSDLGFVATAPSNVSVEQFDRHVRVSVERSPDANFRGINLYASTFEGGGTTGYTRVNIDTVATGSIVEEERELTTFDVDADVATNPDGSHAADPLFVEYISRQVDQVGDVLQGDFTERVEVPEYATRVRSKVTLTQIRETEVFSFDHSRTANATSTPPTVFVGAFAATPSTEPLYYVTTAVFYDESTQIEFESPFSMEVVGRPLRVSSTVGNLPVRSRRRLVEDVITSIRRSNPQVKVEPGSVLRDTFIDPFASESERLRFILDFFHRARTFPGLLQIDDPENTGTSVPVAASTYKRAMRHAFALTSDNDVQALIDRAFEALASNYGKFRRPGRFARGRVTFFTTRRPTRTLPIPLGTTVAGGSIEFRVTRGSSMPLEQLASLFDPVSGRYRVTVTVQATSVGAAGNVAAGQIRRIVSGVTGFGLSVINTGSMFGGEDEESNLKLAERSMNALASVDSGTVRGYLQTVADVPGVLQAKVVPAGDPLMQRDLDETGRHRGGKVDVWMQGENIATVTDTFAFAFDIARDVHFVLVGDPAQYTFRAVDPSLTQNLPIEEMLDSVSAGYFFRNATTGDLFDLTDVEIVNFDTIRLSTDVVQPPVTLTDVVLGSYRRRTGNTFTFPRKPVRQILSVVGTQSGVLDEAAYRLVRPDPPLLYGRSVLANDYLEIVAVAEGGAEGGAVSVVGEPHVLVGDYPDFLERLGVNVLTIVVTSADGSVVYRGPNHPSGVSDYTILDGTETTPVAIKRVSGGDIASGDTVLVSYEHQENFTVTYTVNNMVRIAQDVVDEMRHVTADVVVKEAIAVPIDLAATVIIVQGADQTVVDAAIRTNLSNLFAGLRLGQPLRQGDVVAVIEGTTGVSYVEVPLSKMVRAPGSTVVREVIPTGQTGDMTYLAAWATAGVSVWLFNEPLSAATTDGGGPQNEFRGVFKADQALDLLSTSPSATLGVAAGRAFIIGAGGLSIPGISDHATLVGLGHTTAQEIAEARRACTANRVLVSTSVDDSPTNHRYSVTYVVGDDFGAKNINPGDAEHLVLGPVEFTFDEDR